MLLYIFLITLSQASHLAINPIHTTVRQVSRTYEQKELRLLWSRLPSYKARYYGCKLNCPIFGDGLSLIALFKPRIKHHTLVSYNASNTELITHTNATFLSFFFLNVNTILIYNLLYLLQSNSRQSKSINTQLIFLSQVPQLWKIKTEKKFTGLCTICEEASTRFPTPVVVVDQTFSDWSIP